MTTARDDLLQIIVVCTANRFRSPLAAAVLRQELGGLPVDVQSRGLRNLGPLPPLIQALNAAEQHELSLASHRARALEPGELAAVDLVLTFQRAHVDNAIRSGGARPETVFMLPELVRLLERNGGRRPDRRDYVRSARNLVQLAADLRRVLPARKTDELEDPAGKSDRVFRRTDRAIYRLSTTLAAQLRPAEE
jgi:protein-tyrosine phosphatase